MEKTDPYAEEKKMRKKLRAGKLEPTPKGALVTGRLPNGMFIRTQCEGHLFVTRRPVKDEHWQSGYKQAARCVVCDFVFPAVDSSWWMEVASKDRIRLCMNIVREDRQHLKNVFIYLKEKYDGAS